LATGNCSQFGKCHPYSETQAFLNFKYPNIAFDGPLPATNHWIAIAFAVNFAKN